MHNKSLHWIFTPLRSVKTSELKRYTGKGCMNEYEFDDRVATP